MNSSEPPAMEKAPLAQARPAFNWIEVLAVPIASSIMETQLLILVLTLLLTFFTETLMLWPIDEAGMLLLFLGLQWWAMFVNARARQQLQGNDGQTQLLRVLGLFLALVLLLATHSALLLNMPVLCLSIVLVIWSWWRGIDRSQQGMGEERLILTFKIGFIAVLVILAGSVLYPDSSSILSLLVRSLPLFFLSGLIALSLSRLAAIKRDSALHPGAAQTVALRNWLVILTVVWGMIVAIAVTLEFFSFRIIQSVLQPLWNILGFIAGWIIYALVFLLSGLDFLFGSRGTAPHAPTAQPPAQQPHALPRPPAVASSNSLLIVQLALLIIALLILVLVIRVILKSWHPLSEDENEEEIREGLSARTIRQARRQERNQHKAARTELETLDPASARALYREFLQSMALHEEDLMRRPPETPAEYHARIEALITKAGAQSFQADDPSDTAFLRELTQAYVQERYQGKPIAQHEHTHLKTWLAAFIQRLTARAETTTSPQEKT